MRKWRILLAVVLIIVAIAALAVGVVYLTVAPHSLPSFFPGHTTHPHKPTEYKKGTAGIVAGVVLVAAAIGVMLSGRRRPKRWN
jgi:hypothetical protein